jgi:hypothetical protein
MQHDYPKRVSKKLVRGRPVWEKWRKNGVAVHITRSENGSYCQADCKCLGFDIGCHSVTWCPNLQRQIKLQAARDQLLAQQAQEAQRKAQQNREELQRRQANDRLRSFLESGHLLGSPVSA